MTIIIDGTTGVPVSPVTGTLAVANGGTGVTTSTGSGANVLGTSPSISGAVMTTMASSVITSGTAQASTSGTSIDFTSIPSWVKRITVMFQGVSSSGTSDYLVRLGSGSPTTTGYLTASVNTSGASSTTTNNTTGFVIPSGGASAVFNGVACFCTLGSNAWAGSGILAQSDTTRAISFSGSISLGGTLDRVRITTVNGTDTFDAGSINILYE